MLRNYHSDYSVFLDHQEIANQTAFHEAGHAVSIYLGNKAKNLPPVYFQIKITKTDPEKEKQIYFAKVIDGHLIQSIPIPGIEKIGQLGEEEQRLYQQVYEADIINLLVGPLAEAKYVSIRDDEALNFNLLNPHALNYYGGSSDVKKAYSYLEYFITSEYQREKKMLELFSQAYDFIQNNQNWICILNLAHHILNDKNEILSCEEAVDVINQCLDT